LCSIVTAAQSPATANEGHHLPLPLILSNTVRLLHVWMLLVSLHKRHLLFTPWFKWIVNEREMKLHVVTCCFISDPSWIRIQNWSFLIRLSRSVQIRIQLAGPFWIRIHIPQKSRIRVRNTGTYGTYWIINYTYLHLGGLSKNRFLPLPIPLLSHRTLPLKKSRMPKSLMIGTDRRTLSPGGTLGQVGRRTQGLNETRMSQCCRSRSPRIRIFLPYPDP